MDSSDSHHKHDLRSAVLAKALLVSGVLLASAHPISCHDFWWQLSRGRAVAQGSLTPTQDLVSGSVGGEADWFGGVPFYLVYDAFGPMGLMLMKIAVASLAATMIFTRLHGHRCLVASICTVTVVSSRSAWEPTPLLLETIGLILTMISARRWTNGPSIVGLLPLLLTALVWGNCGPASIICVVVAAVEIWRSQTKPLARIAAMVAVVAACCVTPASFGTLSHSVVSTLPVFFEDTVDMNLWFSDMHKADSFAFAGLTGMAFIGLLFGKPPATTYACSGFFIAQVLAVTSDKNLPMGSVLMSMSVFAPVTSRLTGLTIDRDKWNRIPCSVVSICVAMFCCLLASGAWDACGSGPGWGIDPRIENSAFEASVKNIRMTESAHCVGIREAGLLAWHVRQGVKPYDTPQTALLNGRHAEHALLTSDLTISWQTPHRRPNGKWGGWWNTAKRRKLKMLVVPCENLALVRALEPSIWKPISLNAVSLVYGRAGDPDCSSQIVKILSLRHFVDRGEWQHVIRSDHSRSFIDLANWFSDGFQTYECLRLARVFRAMRLNLAALRVLRVLQKRKGNSDVVRDEFAKNQIELGYEERLATGRSSRLRFQAYQMAMGSQSADAESVLNWRDVGASKDVELPTIAINKYVSGNTAGAIDEMTDDRAEALYARAMLMLEIGQTENAAANLTRVVSEFSKHRIVGAAKAALLSFDGTL